MPPLPLMDEDGKTLPAATGAAETLYVAFKTTCPTCALTWPYLERVRQASEGGMRVVAISQDPPAATREFQERHGAHIEIAYDAPPWPVSEQLGVTTVPTFFRVGPDGTIEETRRGLESRAHARLRAARRGPGGSREHRHHPTRRPSPRLQTGMKLEERLVRRRIREPAGEL